MPTINPNAVTGTGANTRAEVSHLTGVWIEKTATCHTCPHQSGESGGGIGQLNVYVRLMQTTGIGDAGPTSGPLVKRVRIID